MSKKANRKELNYSVLSISLATTICFIFSCKKPIREAPKTTNDVSNLVVSNFLYIAGPSIESQSGKEL